MKGRCLTLSVLFILLLACSVADENKPHKLSKRQAGFGSGIPLSRRRQFPPPEELVEEYSDSSEDDSREDYSEEEPQTTPAQSQRTTARTAFNNRFQPRPRFGGQPQSSSSSSPAQPAATSSRTPAQSQRLDVVADILNRAPAPRPSPRSVNVAKPAANEVTKATESDVSKRPSSVTPRSRPRGRVRTRSTSTTTTTTTTPAPAPATEEYYYYYDDESEASAATIATTSSTTTTTTTTTTKRPTFSRRPTGYTSSSRSRSTARPVVRFDPDAVQFAPPPDKPADVVKPTVSTTKRYTTSTTPEYDYSKGGQEIPVHLRNRYRPRTDGRFIDFLRDPNRPRELKGFDLTDYPFYITVPDDITFECEDRKDGYYASIPHRCQLFHYCFANARYDFLCANYTLYDQTTFTCRFANNVDCEASEKFYVRNEELWKEDTTTPAPKTTTKKPRKKRPDSEEDYDEEEYDYDEEEEERRRNRRRRRRKNRRKQEEDDA